MPVSTSVHITHCLGHILTLNPRSILDVGCGFGMWGFLGRMYLDVMPERVQPEEWQTRIDGLELFEPYIQAHQRALYSKIIIGDIRELAPNVDNYELIIAGDVIEHLDKDDAERVIEQLYEKATRALLVNIPIGDGWDHPERHGNPGELHRSQWSPDDFLAYPSASKMFTLPCGQYGSFYCPKDCPLENKIDGLLSAAEYQQRSGRVDRAITYAERAHRMSPESRDAVLFLVDLWITDHKMDQAIELLRQQIGLDPAFHFAYIALAQLLAATSRNSEAHAYARRLLARPNLTEDERRKAESVLA